MKATYTPFPLLKPMYEEDPNTGLKNKLKGYKRFNNRCKHKLQTEIIIKALQDQKRGYCVDENAKLVIEKYLERKQKDFENNFKNHIYVSLPLKEKKEKNELI